MMANQEFMSNKNESGSNIQFDERKGIRLNRFQAENWDPEYIRQKFDLLSKSDVKQLKDSLSNNQNKTIRLNESQAQKWDPDVVKHFLTGVKRGVGHKKDLGQESIYKQCCGQLINLFDQVFELDFLPSTLDQIINIIDKEVDEQLVKKVRESLQ